MTHEKTETFKLFNGVDTNNSKQVLDAIAKGANVNATLSDGYKNYIASLPPKVCSKQSTSSSEQDREKDLAERINEPLMTPLLLALSKEYLEIAKILINQQQINVNLKNGANISPLYMLLMVSNREEREDFQTTIFDLFQLLISKGANIESNDNVNLESRALLGEHVLIFEYLSQLPTHNKDQHYLDNVRDYLRIKGKKCLLRLDYLMKRPQEWRDSVFPNMIKAELIKAYASNSKDASEEEIGDIILLITQLMNIAFTYKSTFFDEHTFKGYLKGAGSTLDKRIKELLEHPKKNEQNLDAWVNRVKKLLEPLKKKEQNLQNEVNSTKPSSSEEMELQDTTAAQNQKPALSPRPSPNITSEGEKEQNLQSEVNSTKPPSSEEMELQDTTAAQNQKPALSPRPSPNITSEGEKKPRIAPIVNKNKKLAVFTTLLTELHSKGKQLGERSSKEADKKASEAVATLHTALSDAGTKYFAEEISYSKFKNVCDGAIKIAQVTLETHRGWKNILGNIALFLVSLARSACNGQWVFFSFQTDSMKKVGAIQENISFLDSKDDEDNSLKPQ